MPRFNRSLTLWTFALLVASVLLAWPLHEALHVSQPITALSGASTSSVEGTTSDAAADFDAVIASAFDDHGDADGPDGVSGAGEAKGGGCAWCLFHAQLFAASDTPLVFSFHAEASSPPIAPPSGLPTGRCALAAEPRGPPRA
ncbi:DUF2946 family protein [Mitsuaria sp. 7]|uniref:DUF2946 family protein n=1 Tax=Mitsuaria sp. 7 TaxID=1658665 RepID=UPI0007DDCE3E|nr:DUF2946 family protein [Mitsuaria sp. 7]ANH67631.1 hypothetical protein ABE85_08720 [Mitsuaria sp. 7]